MNTSQYNKLLSQQAKKALSKASYKNIRKSNIRIMPIFGRMSLTRGQEKALDTLWAKAIKKLAGNECEKCHKTDNLHSHHAIGRRNKTIRHSLSNGFSLCAGCHFFAEQNGIAFALWAISKRGQKWFDDLEAYGREVKIFKDYAVIKAYLESFL